MATAFPVSQLLRENQQEERGTGLKLPPQYLHKDYGKQLFMTCGKILGEDFRGVPY